MSTVDLFAGAALCLAVAAPVSWMLIRRSARRARLAERRARTAERMAESAARTGGLAHEIKNPLSTIGLNAQLLAEGVAESDMQPEEKDRLVRRVGVLRREVDRLRDILESFLRFAGEVRLDPRPANLNDLLEELADFYLPQAQRHGVRLRVSPAPEAAVANVDPGQMKQALLNLMINATQAMAGADDSKPGAAQRELMLRCELARDDEKQPVCRVHVTDTGPGINAERMARLFQPYFTTKSGGAGLGLSITRRIVEAHGGRIEAHSEDGRGADFIITLPRLVAGPEARPITR